MTTPLQASQLGCFVGSPHLVAHLVGLFKEAYFYADLLQVTSRCAIRGIFSLPTHKQELCAPRSNVFSSHAPRLIVPSVASAPQA